MNEYPQTLHLITVENIGTKKNYIYFFTTLIGRKYFRGLQSD